MTAAPTPFSESERVAGETALVRPGMRGLPHRALIREVVLLGDPGALTVMRADRRLRRLRVGPGQDVERAQHLGGPQLAKIAPHLLGAIDLIAPDGTRVARLDLRDWVPEADELTTSVEALRRSGLAPLLERAGLPLRPVPPAELAEALRAAVPPVLPLRGLPWAYTVVRSAAVVAAFFPVVLAGYTDVPDLLWRLVSLGLLLSTLAALGLWSTAVLRDRIDDGDHPVLRPNPSVPVTRRFARLARLRVEPEVVVVIDGLGRERRLPRSGALAVTSAAVVRDGTPTAQIELRTDSGVSRATLPWDQWCGGQGGEVALQQACHRGGLVLRRWAAPAGRPHEEERRARSVFSSHVRGMTSVTIWPRGLPGAAAVWQTAAFAWLSFASSWLDDPPPGTRAILAATLCLAVLPHVARLVARRWWLDVPVARP